MSYTDAGSNHLWQPNAANAYLTALEDYKDATVRRFPALPKRVVDNWSIFPIDALTLGYFLNYYPRNVVVLDIGTFVGTSAFYFARHPNVTKVISVDPNPSISDELTDKSDAWGRWLNLEPLKDIRVHDVARTVLEDFDNEREKIQLLEGVVGSHTMGVNENPQVSPKKVEVPRIDPSAGAGIVAFVDGLHTREGIHADLTAIFDQNADAVAILDDCRHAWGPYVQAGVVDFMQQASDEYRFRLLGDLGPGLATSNLGLVYPSSFTGEVEETLRHVGSMFSQRLDLLRLLSREEELISTVNITRRQLQQLRHTNSQLETRMSRLEKRNSDLTTQMSRLEKRNSDLTTQVSRLKEKADQLYTHYSSKRYAIADAAVSTALRIPAMKSLVRRSTS